MPWVKIDDAMPHHPKVVAGGPLAFALDVAALAYANKYGTRGRIDAESLPAVFPGLPNPRKHAATLVRTGRWTEVDGGWEIHDYHDFQPTPEEREALSQKRSEAGRRGGKASGQARSKQVASPDVDGCSDSDEAKSNPVPGPVPVPSPSLVTSSSVLQPHPDPDDDQTAEAEQVPEAVWQLFADRRMAVAQKVDNPTRYRARCVENAKREHGRRALELWNMYEIDPGKLADALNASGPVPWLNLLPKRLRKPA